MYVHARGLGLGCRFTDDAAQKPTGPRHLDRDDPPLCDARTEVRSRQGEPPHPKPLLDRAPLQISDSGDRSSVSYQADKGIDSPLLCAVQQMILAVLPSDPPSSAPSTSSTSSSSASTSRSSSRPPSRLLIVVWSLEQDPNLVADDRSARRRTNGKKGAVPVEVPRLGGRGAAGAEGKDSSVEVEMAALSLQEGQDSVPKRSTTEDREDDDDKDDKDEDEPAQDVFVPWARQNQISKAEKAAAAKSANPASTSTATNCAPSRADPTSADSASRPPPAATPAASSAAVSSIPTELKPAPTFNRYYHLFRHYELSNLVRSAALQLGLAFSAPESYPLPEVDFVAPSSSDDDDDGRGRRAVNERDGWEAKVRLCEERWERENWVVEVEVGWERSAQ